MKDLQRGILIFWTHSSPKTMLFILLLEIYDRETLKSFFGSLRAALSQFKVVRAQIVIQGEVAATRSVVTGIFDREFQGPNGCSFAQQAAD